MKQGNWNAISDYGQSDKHVKVQEPSQVWIFSGEEINPTTDCYIVSVSTSGVDKHTDDDNEEKNEIGLREKGLVEFLWELVVDFGNGRLLELLGLLGLETHLILLG